MAKITGFAQDTATADTCSEKSSMQLASKMKQHCFDAYLVMLGIACVFALCYAIFMIGARYGKHSIIDRISKSGYTYIEKTATSNGSTTMSVEIIENH